MKFQAFTTAAVQDDRIRTKIKAALSGNLKRGEGAKEFANVVNGVFDSAGLSRLKPYQINTIYDTNTSLSYGAGQMQSMTEVKGVFPYWKYSAVIDSNTREDHRALHGKIFANGDFTFFPPIGFKCRCTAIPLTARQAGRYPKSDIPDTHQRQAMGENLGNAEFLGDKQTKFISWLSEQYKPADKQTRAYIDDATKQMRKNISKLNEQSTKELIGVEYSGRLEKELNERQDITKEAKRLKLNKVDTLRLYAYTDINNKLAFELAQTHYSDYKPTRWSTNQLMTFKRGLRATLKKLPDAPGLVYRNVDSKYIPETVVKQWTTVGNVIKWDAFSSTTKDDNIYNNRNIRFVINQKTGRDISKLSKFPNEKETLLLTGTGFKITDVINSSNQTIIYANEI